METPEKPAAKPARAAWMAANATWAYWLYAHHGQPLAHSAATFALGAAALAAYLAPALVAGARGHRHAGAVWAATVLFGWTGLGWGLALVWALCTDKPNINNN